LAALRRVRGRGFTYLGLMFLIALMGMAAAMASAVWSTTQRREDERELVFAGRMFAAAIDSFRSRALSPDHPFPQQLEDLLHDERGTATVRHLRRIYLDPMTGERKWGLVRLPDGGIVGVYSLSERTPFQRASVSGDFAFPFGSKSYRDWHFVARSAAGLVPSDADSPTAVELTAPLRSNAEAVGAALVGQPGAPSAEPAPKAPDASTQVPAPEPEPVVPDGTCLNPGIRNIARCNNVLSSQR